MTRDDREQPHYAASSAACAIDDLWQAGGRVDSVAWRLDEMVRAILDERHEATAGLPQAPADGGESEAAPDRTELEIATRFAADESVFMLRREYKLQDASDAYDAIRKTLRYVLNMGYLTDLAAANEQVAALTAERDELTRQLETETAAKMFNIKEVADWSARAVKHKRRANAYEAVVEAAKLWATAELRVVAKQGSLDGMATVIELSDAKRGLREALVDLGALTRPTTGPTD